MECIASSFFWALATKEKNTKAMIKLLNKRIEKEKFLMVEIGFDLVTIGFSSNAHQLPDIIDDSKMLHAL
jgi:hypothetical protein